MNEQDSGASRAGDCECWDIAGGKYTPPGQRFTNANCPVHGEPELESALSYQLTQEELLREALGHLNNITNPRLNGLARRYEAMTMACHWLSEHSEQVKAVS